jgi:hypothetical protein
VNSAADGRSVLRGGERLRVLAAAAALGARGATTRRDGRVLAAVVPAGSRAAAEQLEGKL